MAARTIMYGFIVLHCSATTLVAEVGSQACAPCHPVIFKSYTATAMARSAGAMDARSRLETFERANVSQSVRVSSEESGVWFAIEDGSRRLRRRLDYFIGSGLAGRSYLSSLDGFLFQAPVSYYTSQKRWDVSPGFEKRNELQLTRGVETGCLRCHVSRLRAVEGTVNGYESPAFLEGGVSCERCHGSGDAHVARMKHGEGPLKIVNPAKLDAGRRDSVCAQCHLSGVTEIARKDGRLYEPGGLLTDTSVVFVWSRGGTLKANSHFERMTQSVCWQASEKKMWCGTCHEAHPRPAAANRASYYRARCLTCHTDASCSEKRSVRANAKNDCLQCHMPRTEMQTVRHAEATNHSIPRSLKDLPRAEATSGVLIPFFEGQVGDRELGLAYADVALRDENRELGMRAFELLRKIYEADRKDTRVGTQLAQLYDRMGDDAKACEVYGEVVAADPNAVAPAVNLGSCLARRGQIDESVKLWTGALRRSPGLVAARTNLAVALMGMGKGEEAAKVVEEGLRIDPLSQHFESLLAKLRSQ